MNIQLFSSFCAGLLFGIGLVVANMTDPQKVLNFLNITGNWDASLALVMAAGLTVFSSGYFFLVKPRKAPLLNKQFFIPTRQAIDNKLITGAIFFGIGWGLTGICPGPAITNIVSGNAKIIVFILFMLNGMFCAKLALALNAKKLSEKSI